MATYKDTLCINCKNVRKIENNRGSLFLMCRMHAENKRYPKYPPQPVYSCKGFEEEAKVKQDPEEEW